MTVYPCAKINLGLNVVNRRSDGYHDLQTVFYPIGIHDELSITEVARQAQDEFCSLHVEGMSIDGDVRKNLVVRAYNLLAEHYELPPVSVRLVKRIPMQAGMGGGSSDCAYMITALNDMFGLGMDVQEMRAHAARLGADCAFFITPVPSYAEGIGEKLMPVQLDLSRYKIAIVKPPVAISTKEAFANITPRRPEACCRDIVSRPVEEWRDVLVNDFERGLLPSYSVIGDIKNRLYGLGAVYAAMSGSGSAFFGIFNEAPHNLGAVFEDCFTSVVNGSRDI